MTATSAASPRDKARARRQRNGKTASARPGDPEFYRGDAYQINESIGYLLRQVRNAIDRAIDAEMSDHALTGAQWGPLMILHCGMGTTAAELARVAGVDTGAMTRMLDRLERKGLVRRTRCPKDRRVVKLELTAEGRQLCSEIPFGLSRVLNALLHGFTEDELETFKSLARRMLANAHRP
jgi:DNA-binding MarR family transcriptional regulator